MLLSTAIEHFTTYLKANCRSGATIDCYRRDLTALLRFAGDLDTAALTSDVLNRFIVSNAVQRKADGAPRSEVTINRCKSALRSYGAWMVDAGLAQRSPAGALSIRRTSRQSPSTLTDSERKRMLRELGARKGEPATRDRVMLELLLGTGIRLSELVGLDIGNVDLEGKQISIRAKGGNDETRFINTSLRRLLRSYLRHRKQSPADSPALFLSNRECRISKRQVQARFRLWLQWAGIDRPGLSLHSTRHTFASRMYLRSKDLVLVGRALGHKSVEATQVYVRCSDEELEDVLETL